MMHKFMQFRVTLGGYTNLWSRCAAFSFRQPLHIHIEISVSIVGTGVETLEGCADN